MSSAAAAQQVPATQGIAVVERAVLVLQTVVAADGPLGLRELARRVSLPPATTLRLVRTLDGLGILERLTDGSVRPGPDIGTLVPAQAPGVPIARLKSVLRRMVEVFDEGATAGIDAGDETLFVAHVGPESAVQVADIAGDRWPMHATASGFVLMTAWSEDRLADYLDGPLKQPSPRTPTDPDAIRTRIDAARRDGYAWSAEEATLETCGLAVPVVDRAGEVAAAVGLYGPLYRISPADAVLPRQLIELIDELRGTVFS